jgi:hypothetical protein
MLPAVKVGDTDTGTKVDRPAQAAAQAALRPAGGEGSLLPAKMAAARVRDLDSSGGAYVLETAPADQQTAFQKRVRQGGTITQVLFMNPRSSGEAAGFDAMRRNARAAGARLLLVYEHKTPLSESGSLIYKVVFDSKARGTVYNAETGAAVCSVQGDCVGTLGGLTPLQMAVHPQVEPETKRQALEKMADAIRDTLQPSAVSSR